MAPRLFAAAACAAVRGSIEPRLLTPSVSSTITRDPPWAPRSRLAAVAMAGPMAVPSSSCPGWRFAIAACTTG